MLDCEKFVTYKKVDANEIIEVGDIVMIDPENGYITRAVVEGMCDAPINSRLVVGVCVQSNNYAKAAIVIDGGKAKNINRKEVSSTSSSTDIILLDGGPSTQNARELIQVAYAGEWPVNVCGFVDLGDRLCISAHPGKAKAIDYTDRHYFSERSIGKVIKYVKNREQVIVLLDIE